MVPCESLHAKSAVLLAAAESQMNKGGIVERFCGDLRIA